MFSTQARRMLLLGRRSLSSSRHISTPKLRESPVKSPNNSTELGDAIQRKVEMAPAAFTTPEQKFALHKQVRTRRLNCQFSRRL